MSNNFIISRTLRYSLAAVILIAVAALLRIWPLQSIGSNLAWLTFYPAVMIAAIYGGIYTGLFSTLLACLVVEFSWPLLVVQPFIRNPADYLGMAVFVLTSFMISLVSEAMRRANARAKKAQENAEAASKAKSVFLSNMSHELRTPLNAILGFSRIMSNAPDVSPEHVQNLEIVIRSGEHLLNLINNVLDISKIESGRVALEERTIDLHNLIHETQSLMHVRAVQKGLGFAIDISPDFPRYISVDAGKLRQIMINLIGNAIKFTKNGRICLRARVAKHLSPQSTLLRFEIEDSGPGISADDTKRIFSPFVQLGDQPATEAGTGLGLVISKQYVELMGGRIDVASELGKGSVFNFEIPVRISPTPIAEMPEKPLHGRVIGLAEGQPRYRLLIAEDQPENRLLLQKLLDDLGFELRLAVNGKEAVELCEQWRPHLVWMDIRMPVMDGLEATRRIKADAAGAQIKIIALTAHALEDERQEILAAGCDDFIRKPYRETEIFEALEKNLGVHFRYAEYQERPTAIGELDLSAAQLEELPAGLLEELRDAAILLDGEHCLEVVEKIHASNPSLGGRLHHMLSHLQYKELLVVLDTLIARRSA